MKKLIILFLLLPFFASAQTWVNFNAYGLQRKIVSGDTTWRFVGSGSNGTLSFNPNGGGGGIDSVKSANSDISFTGTNIRIATLNSGIGANKIVKRGASGETIIGSTTEFLFPSTNEIQYKAGSSSTNGSHAFYVNGLVATFNLNGLITNNVFVNTDTYDGTWAGVTSVPTKADLYTKIQTLQGSLTLTTTGTSGAATLVGTTLNIPQYSGGGGSGTVNSGNANHLAYYATTGTAVSEIAAISPNKVLISDANGLPIASSVTNTTLGYLDATSSIQTQLNGKVTGTSNSFTPTVTASSNVTSASSANFYYIRIGNIVMVQGSISFTATSAATPSLITMSPPVATSTTSFIGHGSGENVNNVWIDTSGTTTIGLHFVTGVSLSGQIINFSYSYIVI